MGVLKFILLYGIEAILISDKTCWRYTDCNYLDAFCKCDWSGGWPPPCSCACNYRGKFVETAVANSVTIKDESFESLCQYESSKFCMFLNRKLQSKLFAPSHISKRCRLNDHMNLIT